MSSMSTRTQITAALVVATAFVICGRADSQEMSTPDSQPSSIQVSKKVYSVSVGDSFAIGPPNASVVMIEFADFQCALSAYTVALVKRILEAHPNDVRFVYKSFPLTVHRNAMSAAQAAVAAGRQGKFFEMHDKLFVRYRDLGEDQYAKAAEELSLDVDKFGEAFANPATQALIAEEMRQGREVGVDATPTFFINGRKVNPTVVSYEVLERVIDEALEKAKAAG